MKYSFSLLALLAIVLLASECKSKEKKQVTADTATIKPPTDVKSSDPAVYKGKLEIAAICMNYTISELEGRMDTALTVASWTDETTNKTYSNVFRLKNHCDFPDSIKQGNEFRFVIDTSSKKQCAVCLAYYPTPSKAVGIKVVD
jgi:hypothetical protein